MSATSVAAIGVGLAVVGRWAHNQPALTTRSAAGSVVAVGVIAALDRGKTAQIATGFAWLILVAVMLSKNSPVSGIATAINKSAKPAAKPKSKTKKK